MNEFQLLCSLGVFTEKLLFFLIELILNLSFRNFWIRLSHLLNGRIRTRTDFHLDFCRLDLESPRCR